jgi:hypothetical protein
MLYYICIIYYILFIIYTRYITFIYYSLYTPDTLQVVLLPCSVSACEHSWSMGNGFLPVPQSPRDCRDGTNLDTKKATGILVDKDDLTNYSILINYQLLIRTFTYQPTVDKTIVLSTNC